MSKCEICGGDFNRGMVVAHCNNCWNKNLVQSRKEGLEEGCRLGAKRELEKEINYLNKNNHLSQYRLELHIKELTKRLKELVGGEKE